MIILYLGVRYFLLCGLIESCIVVIVVEFGGKRWGKEFFREDRVGFGK